MKTRHLIAQVAALCALADLASAQKGDPKSDQKFIVVVNAANTVSQMSADGLSKIFLKKSRRWPDGQLAMPVDLNEKAPAREAFTQTVLHKDVHAVQAYWQQQIFSGADVPPAEKDDPADVLAFVRANPNAVGYVSAGTELGGGVKVVRVE
jgi:ABC-type phosphate transport system substrate-binding protein